jgi:hypothetical protein
VFPIVDLISGEPNPSGCEEDPVYTSATNHGAAGCAVGQFFDVGTGKCWTCPSGFNRSVLPIVDLITGDPSGNGCHKPASSIFTAANTATASGGTDCPSGYVYDFLLGQCYKCPSGYSKRVLVGWDSSAACEKVTTTTSTTSASRRNGTGFFGTDCPSGYVYDFGLGYCYKCPSGYGKHVLRSWAASNACTKTTTTTSRVAANNTSSSGGTDCPSGYVYDFLLGKCYKCPSGYNKYVLRGWDHSHACEKIIPEEWTAATDHGGGLCGDGEFLDIGLGTCWSCPSGYSRTILFPVDGNKACEKTVPDLVAATRHGKYHCDQRNPDWFLDIGRGECWSCPPGAWRNLNPVNGGAACNVPKDFGDLRSAPADTYARFATAQATFWAGNPGNAFGTGGARLVDAVPTFLMVQKKTTSGQWQTVKTDADWDTIFEWKAAEGSGVATIKWMIPGDAESGVYRFTHEGYSGDLFGVSSYGGQSSEFNVVE